MELTAGRSIWSTSYTTDGGSVAQRAVPFWLDTNLNEFEEDVSREKIRKETVSRIDVEASFIATVPKNIFYFKVTDLLESLFK